MRLREMLGQIRKIYIPQGGCPVEKTIADELKQELCVRADIETVPHDHNNPEQDSVFIGVMDKTWLQKFSGRSQNISTGKEWVYFDISAGRRVLFASSQSHFLYAVFSDIKGFCVFKTRTAVICPNRQILQLGNFLQDFCDHVLVMFFHKRMRQGQTETGFKAPEGMVHPGPS